MQLFLSHIKQEESFATTLKGLVESAFAQQCEVFISSENIPPGDDWLETIKAKIRDSEIILCLCSRDSVTHPWINFEVGCGAVLDKMIIPICHLGQLSKDLRDPIKRFQGIDLVRGNEKEFCERLITGLSKQLNIPVSNQFSFDRMASELKKRGSRPYVNTAGRRNIHDELKGFSSSAGPGNIHDELQGF